MFTRLIPTRTALAFTLLCVVLANASIGWIVLQSRSEVLQNADRNAQRLVQLLEEQTRKAFQTADLILLSLQETLEAADPPPEHDPHLREKLQTRVGELPHIRAFRVIGPDGVIIHDTEHPATSAGVLADKDYLMVHRRDATAGLFVGKPMTSESDETWLVPLSRRIERSGSFAGVVVATLAAKFFEDLYRKLELGSRDSVALFTTDAALIARFPEIPDLIGQTWPQFSLFQEHLPRTSAGTFHSDTFQHGQAVVSYRSLAPLPLVATVALNEGDLLAGWRRSAAAWGLAGAAGSALIVGLIFTLDIQRKEREAALQRALQAQRLEALGQMTGGIAHDFNNVLAAVGASFRLMRKGGADEQYVSAGEEALQRGVRLASQLLRFAKTQEMSCREEDLNELLRSLEPMIRQAAGSNARLILDLAQAVPGCLIDRVQFDAAIVNLVVNAAQAMNEDGEIVIATSIATLEPAGQCVAVRVQDNGCGIPPADLKRVFEPFYTTKKDVGTGLGLAQVHAFMRQTGGEITIASAPGRGTTVELLFPCRSAPTLTAAPDQQLVLRG